MIQATCGFICGSYNKYLRLPALMERSKYNIFRRLKKKVWQRIHNWKNKFLSQIGRKILIKTILQTILVYTMSVFWLPKVLYKEITTMITRFWWGFNSKANKIYWMSQNWMITLEYNGGMGFKDLESFNLALLEKLL